MVLSLFHILKCCNDLAKLFDNVPNTPIINVTPYPSSSAVCFLSYKTLIIFYRYYFLTRIRNSINDTVFAAIVMVYKIEIISI